ncbi:MAG TPA: DUF4363 family protein [Candidatus Gemmiger faecigallinarum]|nr:DUF4363 family protein [Candidatus Gemmiger faecigallinarum]
MKRNFYAVLLLLAVGAVVFFSGRFVRQSTDRTQRQVQQAYRSAQDGQFETARTIYRQAAEDCRADSRLLYLLVRRSLLDEINESLALIADYAQQDNLADLGVETARVTEQLEQLQASFLAAF